MKTSFNLSEKAQKNLIKESSANYRTMNGQLNFMLENLKFPEVKEKEVEKVQEVEKKEYSLYEGCKVWCFGNEYEYINEFEEGVASVINCKTNVKGGINIKNLYFENNLLHPVI